MTLCVDDNFNGQRIQVPVGETVEITLLETRTTGFRWAIVRNGEPACRPEGESSEFKREPPGAPGVHRYRFLAVTPGTSQIELHNCRHWQPEAAPARVFTLEVRVTRRDASQPIKSR